MFSGRENAYEDEEESQRHEHHHHHHHQHHEREEPEEEQHHHHHQQPPPPYGSGYEPRRSFVEDEGVLPGPYGHGPPVHDYGGGGAGGGRGPYEGPGGVGGGPYETPPGMPHQHHYQPAGMYQDSPYAHAPPPPPPAGVVHRHGEEDEGMEGRHHRMDIPGRLVRIFCKADPEFHLSVRPGKGVVMAPANPHDEHQVWVKDESMSTRVRDSTGSPAFALVNKATGQALQHAPADLEQVLLADVQLGARDESLLWSQSEDMGEGYRCIRMASKITSNLDALQGDKKSGGVKDGTPIILFKWKKQENQIWKIIPA